MHVVAIKHRFITILSFWNTRVQFSNCVTHAFNFSHTHTHTANITIRGQFFCIMRIIIINERLIDDWPYLRPWFIVESCQRKWHAHEKEENKNDVSCKWAQRFITQFNTIEYIHPHRSIIMIDPIQSNDRHYILLTRKFPIQLTFSIKFVILTAWVSYSYLIGCE